MKLERPPPIQARAPAAAPEAAQARQSNAIRIDPFALERELYDDEDGNEPDGGSESFSAATTEDRARLKSREQQLLKKSAAQKAAAAAAAEALAAGIPAPAPTAARGSGASATKHARVAGGGKAR